MAIIDPKKIYMQLKKHGLQKYDEQTHCPLILKIMLDKKKGRISAFCTEVIISEDCFYRWVNKYELFRECYSIGRIFAREAWEKDGMEQKDFVSPPGTINHAFEHWKMTGWSRFGVSKNSRIKLQLDPKSNPNDHYSQLLRQAANGDFTAAEIKQLMEAINVGLNTHQAFELQREIDQLKSDLATMITNSNVKNSFTNQGIAQKDKDTLADSLC